MKWIKKNWIYVILVALIGCLILNDVLKTNSYIREIDDVSDSLVILRQDYSELEKAADISAELVSAYKFATIAYQDSLQFSNRQLINQKRSYEKAMANLTRVPTDSLYRELTGWLDSLSVQW